MTNQLRAPQPTEVPMPWSRSDIIAFASFIVAVIGAVASILGVGATIMTQEIREEIGLGNARPAAASTVDADALRRSEAAARARAESIEDLRRSQERLRALQGRGQ
ncbi:MAG: hypothetical protein U0359_41790 [Byssovorax sp.]